MKSDPPESCMIVFARAPIAGHVKTRLARDLGASVAVDLHKNFVEDIVEKITSCGHVVKIFYDPADAGPTMRDWLGHRYDYFQQTGEDLGLKMANAFQTVFDSGIQEAVLMGSDFPDLPEKYITDALKSLQNHDAVIGPAVDGGYYLIGFRADTFLPAVFDDKPWGTPEVYQKTMRDFAAADITVRQLPKWRDVDEYDDLIHLVQSLKHDPGQAKNTCSYLNRIGLIDK